VCSKGLGPAFVLLVLVLLGLLLLMFMNLLWLLLSLGLLPLLLVLVLMRRRAKRIRESTGNKEGRKALVFWCLCKNKVWEDWASKE